MHADHFTFLVNDEPYCLWDTDLVQRTIEFLDGIDPVFFSYVAEAHAENLDSVEHRRRVASAVRMAYLHGLEALMTLVGAAVQAPQAPYAWVALAKTDLLRALMERISTGDQTLHAELVNWDRTWEGFAQRVFACCTGGDWAKTAVSFGKVWSVLSAEFLDEMNQLEYNSLKHGFRARPSGVRIAFGLQDSPGQAARAERMVSLGGSETGSTFFAVHRSDATSGNRSVVSQRHTVNWTPERLSRGLQIIDVSIRNIVSFIRVANGASPGKTQFYRLEGVDDLTALVSESVGIRTSSFGTSVVSRPVRTKKDLLEELTGIFAQPDGKG